jgi:hypothetical protein
MNSLIWGFDPEFTPLDGFLALGESLNSCFAFPSAPKSAHSRAYPNVDRNAQKGGGSGQN